MKDQFRIACTTLLPLLALLAAPAFCQQSSGSESELPAPRLPDGTINLSAPAGESGFWTTTNGTLVNNPDSYEKRNANARVHIKDVPLQDWARALTIYRHDIYLASEPYTRCKPAPGPRQIMSPYGFDIVQEPDAQQIHILTISDAMSFRTIYLDGRGHPEHVRPSYFGHSVGHWEGDTLVIDTVGMGERSWMSRDGLPTTDQFHMIERITRASYSTMDYTVTIDDPGAYTAPWTSGFGIEWNPGTELFEYMCQQNNISPAAMIGEGRMSMIVP